MVSLMDKERRFVGLSRQDYGLDLHLDLGRLRKQEEFILGYHFFSMNTLSNSRWDSFVIVHKDPSSSIGIINALIIGLLTMGVNWLNLYQRQDKE